MTATFHDPTHKLAEAAESAELTPEEIAARRRYCTWLQYWRDCASPACRRSHRCAGDPTDCYIQRWIKLSDAGRVWVHAGVSAIEYGLTARNAASAADLMLLHHVKTADRLPRHPPRRKRRWLVEGESDAGEARCAEQDW